MKELVTGIIVLCAVLTGLFYGISAMRFATVENSCAVWVKEAEREVKYVSSWPWYSDCLVKTESGWISAYVLKSVEQPTLEN